MYAYLLHIHIHEHLFSGELSHPSIQNQRILIFISYRAKQLIKNALKHNDFLKKIDKNQVAEIVNCMQEEVYKAGEHIVKQHEGGNHFYVSAGSFRGRLVPYFYPTLKIPNCSILLKTKLYKSVLGVFALLSPDLTFVLT